MIDPNLGFDPNAPGVHKVTNKDYSELYSYVIDPYVYGEIGGPIRELMLRQYQRVMENINRYGPDPKSITVTPFIVDRFRWSLEFQVAINGPFGCHAIVKFMDKRPPNLLILTDKELNNRVVMALGKVINCYYDAYKENWLKEWKKQPRTGR